MTTRKPREQSGYFLEETIQVESACLTLAVTAGAYMEELCVVGGLAPRLLIDHRRGNSVQPHRGTNDLDVGLAVGLLDGRRYASLSERLRREGFEPDSNDRGNPTPQRWKLRGYNVTLDFLMPPIPGSESGGAVQPLEGDFGALIAPGLELAFNEVYKVELAGHTFGGEQVRREIPVCGPGAFVALKGEAFNDRAEPKDAYDLIYVIEHWPDGIESIASALVGHSDRHPAFVARALQSLSRNFDNPSSIGPRRAAAFEGGDASATDIAAADAHGYVDDLLSACRDRGLMTHD